MLIEKENGYSEGMEGKVRCGSLRQKSKVPRACCSQRSEYPGEIVKTQGMNLHHGDEYKEWQKLVGERVCISGVKQGTLRYFGRTNFAQGYWCGVELDEPVGKNNGTVNGVVYFNCKPNHGIFAPVTKVSKLNDLSACNWQFDSREIMTSTQKQETRMRHSNWDYTLGLMNDVELTEKKYIKNSMSDPSFLQATMRTALPRSSESFPYVKRSYMEQHDSSLSFKNIRNFQEVTTRRSKTQPSSSSNTFVKNSSSFNVSKYGYNQKNQYLGSSGLYLDETSESTARHHSFRSNSSIQNSALTEECEQFLRTPTNSGEVSPMSSDTKRFNEMPLYDYSKMPDAFLSAFQPRDFSDFEDEGDAEDRMSVDYDESLGILTPSQMKDLTLGADFKTSLSDIRAMDFPSSESFDDINDLPEDEQVHDVSVFHVSESSATRNVEVSKPNNLGSYNSKTYSAASEDKVHLSSTDKFLYSISHKELDSYGPESCFPSSSNSDTHFTSSEDFTRIYKINNLSAATALHADHQKINNLEKDKYFEEKSLSNMDELSMKGNLHLIQSNSLIAPGVAFPEKHALTLEDQNKTDIDQNISTYHDDGVKSKICPVKNLVNEEMLKRNYDTDDSRDSLQTESENHATMKEKLTVSWEDCLSRSNDSMFPHTERPESVYTVGSNDTGFQEDGELEGMTTSLDSTDGNKRFSTTSRDSCIVADEVDVYKITESNSTSGYSTGLSDSCCNDRVEDDLSSKPLTDEEIQDSVGPCDSEDAFSFQEGNSLSKDPDMMTMESSEITTETVTALCNNDSASDALCETMVEDSTLTEIHELLLSPEENKSSNSIDAKEIATEPRKESTSEEVESPKSHEAKDSDVVSGSPSQSTPEKNPSHPKGKAETARSTTVANRTSRASRLCDDDSDKKKQVAKSPKKNVMSKIKAMIEATSCKAAPRTKNDTNESVSRRAVSAPKKSRWEAVTSKIAASLAEEKTKPKARRDIKSRVDTNLISTRQQNITCRSPKLDSSRLSNCEGSMSPISVSSRDRRPLTERNSTTNSQRETRVKLARDVKQRPKSPRHLHRLLSLVAGCAPVCRMSYVIATPPGPTSKACITSRSVSPESSSAASLNSHSKVPHWKGSTSTVASSAHPPHAKRPPPAASAKATVPSAKSTPRIVSKKPPVPKIRVSAPPSCRVRSPSPSSRASVKQLKADREQTGVRSLHSKPVRPPMWLSKAELTAEIQRLGTLCEARTKELNRLKMETKHVSVGFDAFASLFKYMVEDLNALSMPMLTEDLKKTLKQLELAKQDLAFYEREVEEMKAHHCQELNDLSNKLFQVFHGEVTELSAKHQEEMNRLKSDHQLQIENLSSTFDATSQESITKHEAAVAELQQELISQREELQQLHVREIADLEAKHAQSTKTLQEHIEQLQKKCAELKQHSMGMEDAMRKDTDTKLQWVTSRKVDLEKEVESLKAVLEMKNKELHTLRVQNLEMEKQLEELPLAREKIKMLQARAEDLEALMIEKTKLERKLSTENQQIRDTYERESKVNKRLSMENEELLWRIRQAEQSFLSDSFSVAEYPEDVENGSISPTKSPPPHMSRSVFFTYMDRDDQTSSPRAQYKKVTPGFAASYKTSPYKSPPTPSPRRPKSNSEPPQPLSHGSSTPLKGSKQSSLKQKKRPRSGSDCGKVNSDQADVTFLSIAGSMTSSMSSENSVFGERLLEEHKEQILESLEILREQRSTESSRGEETTPSLEGEDMSRSSEFSDPKTYYHMTFPVSGMPDCDISVAAQAIHSTSESTSPAGETQSVGTSAGDCEKEEGDSIDSAKNVHESKEDRWRTI
ncbi:uncharacterized protein LOC129963103 isoform X3 [Argiope bruennichi]|uniref:uncharacterized protein LOC129963103 isoform X3 n=1 Tax=Argiope bruennichi TaxID=94029 RepID=UPI0024943D66|nr:uncharacterized protein LOC129963103 isoform X3 [Argiope bruennichi]